MVQVFEEKKAIIVCRFSGRQKENFGVQKIVELLKLVKLLKLMRVLQVARIIYKTAYTTEENIYFKKYLLQYQQKI